MKLAKTLREKKWKSLTLLLSLVTLAACQKQMDINDASVSEAAVAEDSNSFIINGIAVNKADLVAKSTVAIYLKTPKSNLKTSIQNYCTGTLIGSTHVLTAAHCFADAAQGMDLTVDELRESSLVAFGTDVVKDSNSKLLQFRNIKSVMIHEKYLVNSVQSATEEPMYDIALIQLDSAAPVGSVVAKLGLNSELKKGMEVTLAGFGLIKVGFLGLVKTQAKQLMKVVVKIDDPVMTETQFTYKTENRKSSCSGDSGGPAYTIAQDGSLTVVGVTSWGDMLCRQVGAYTSVPALAEWITETRTAMH